MARRQGSPWTRIVGGVLLLIPPLRRPRLRAFGPDEPRVARGAGQSARSRPVDAQLVGGQATVAPPTGTPSKRTRPATPRTPRPGCPIQRRIDVASPIA